MSSDRGCIESRALTVFWKQEIIIVSLIFCKKLRGRLDRKARSIAGFSFSSRYKNFRGFWWSQSRPPGVIWHRPDPLCDMTLHTVVETLIINAIRCMHSLSLVGSNGSEAQRMSRLKRGWTFQLTIAHEQQWKCLDITVTGDSQD